MKCNKLENCINQLFNNGSNINCAQQKDLCLISSDSRKSVKCSENGKAYELLNTMHNQVLAYRMDGGIIDDSIETLNRKKCDYLFVINRSDKSVILIELKGKHVADAIVQLDSTLTEFDSVFKKMKKIYGRIIPTANKPDLRTRPEYVKLNKRFMNLNGNLKIYEKYLKEKDIDL